MTMCEHHECRCARAAELAAMGLTLEAVRVHGEQVTCRRPGAQEPGICFDASCAKCKSGEPCH